MSDPKNESITRLIHALTEIRKVAISYNGEYQSQAFPGIYAVYAIATDALIKETLETTV